MTGGGDFWTRRKAAVEAEAKSEAAHEAEETAKEEQAEQESRPDEELLAELDLPDPDTLGPGDDFSPFMSRAVPERLRRRALRRLWLSNPALANVDGLIEYGEDYTDAATVVSGLETTYQVGKGMLAHVEEMARQAAEEEEAQKPQPEPSADDPELVAEVVNTGSETIDSVPESSEDAEINPVKQEDSFTEADSGSTISVRRRMRFDFGS